MPGPWWLAALAPGRWYGLRAQISTRTLCTLDSLLGGSGVDISAVISPLKGVISIVALLITLLTITHEPPSRGFGFRGLGKPQDVNPKSVFSRHCEMCAGFELCPHTRDPEDQL